MDAIVVRFEETVHFSGFEVTASEVSATTGAGLGCFGVGWTGAFLTSHFKIGVSGYVGVDDSEDQKTGESLEASR
jgi:hypothetical protein